MNPWIIVVITLLLSAFFSGVEIAFISANKLRIEVEKKKGKLPALILSHFINIPSKFIGVLLLGNNIALVIYGIAVTSLLEPFLTGLLPDYLNTKYVMLTIITIISTLVILITAEFIPKALFRISPNGILNFLSIPVYFFYYLFYPVIFIFIGISELILKKISRIKFTREKYVFSPIDLDEYIRKFSPNKVSEEEMTQEIQMFQNAIDFKNIKLRECMVPRTEIKALDINDSIDNLKKLLIETGHSKIPVYNDTIDNIIGYTHSFDLFKSPDNIKSILKSIIIVPETMLASEVLKTMIQEHKSTAVVVDEFGGTSGMVTLEDIIEEIFGEIEDEYDVEELVEDQLNDNEFIFSARLEIDYLNNKYELSIPESDEYETLAGFIISQFKDIPETNEEIKIFNFKFLILGATEKRIELVRMKVNEPE